MSEEAPPPPPPPPPAPSVSLWTPFYYLAVLVITMVVFSKWQQQRKREKLATTKHFYEHNFAREAYTQLKESDEKPPKKLIVSALLSWGVEDFTRVLKFKENEPTMNGLLQSGIVGEEFYERFTGSMMLNDRELGEIAQESEGLGFPFAKAVESIKEITQQFAMRRRLDQLDMLKQEYTELLGDAEPDQIPEELLKGL